jgi:hypothetical protein
MQRTIIYTILIALVSLGLTFQISYGQDMSNVRVDELTDTQIRQFLQQVEASGLSESQLEQVAMAKGMSTEEVQKLRLRVDKLKKATLQSNEARNRTTTTIRSASQDTSFNQQPRDTRTEAEKALEELKSKIFGASLFKNANPQFQPNLEIATPQNYVIGTGDEIMIEIYGDSEASYPLRVSPEGNINIPYVGVVPVAGATIESATSRIKNKLETIYSGLRSGNTQVNVTLSNIRSIKVILSFEFFVMDARSQL